MEDKIETDEIELEELEDANFFLGNEFYHDGEYEKAIDCYKSVLENPQEDELVRSKSIYWMGESYIKLKMIDEAIKTLSQFIDEVRDNYLVSSAQRRITYLKEIYGGS